MLFSANPLCSANRLSLALINTLVVTLFALFIAFINIRVVFFYTPPVSSIVPTSLDLT